MGEQRRSGCRRPHETYQAWSSSPATSVEQVASVLRPELHHVRSVSNRDRDGTVPSLRLWAFGRADSRGMSAFAHDSMFCAASDMLLYHSPFSPKHVLSSYLNSKAMVYGFSAKGRRVGTTWVSVRGGVQAKVRWGRCRGTVVRCRWCGGAINVPHALYHRTPRTVPAYPSYRTNVPPVPYHRTPQPYQRIPRTVPPYPPYRTTAPYPKNTTNFEKTQPILQKTQPILQKTQPILQKTQPMYHRTPRTAPPYPPSVPPYLPYRTTVPPVLYPPTVPLSAALTSTPRAWPLNLDNSQGDPSAEHGFRSHGVYVIAVQRRRKTGLLRVLCRCASTADFVV